MHRGTIICAVNVDDVDMSGACVVYVVVLCGDVVSYRITIVIINVFTIYNVGIYVTYVISCVAVIIVTVVCVAVCVVFCFDGVVVVVDYVVVDHDVCVVADAVVDISGMFLLLSVFRLLFCVVLLISRLLVTVYCVVVWYRCRWWR